MLSPKMLQGAKTTSGVMGRYAPIKQMQGSTAQAMGMPGDDGKVPSPAATALRDRINPGMAGGAPVPNQSAPLSMMRPGVGTAGGALGMMANSKGADLSGRMPQGPMGTIMSRMMADKKAGGVSMGSVASRMMANNKPSGLMSLVNKVRSRPMGGVTGR